LPLAAESKKIGFLRRIRIAGAGSVRSVVIAAVAVSAFSASASAEQRASPPPRDARASPYVGGNASPRLPAGAPGRLSVVARGPGQSAVGTVIPVVVRNNTARTAIRISVSASALSASGRLLATGKDQTLNPNVVKPGEIAFGIVYFEDVNLPASARFRFNLTSTAPANVQFENIRDLIVLNSNRIQERVVGMLRNGYPVRVTGPIGASVACFSPSGRLLYIAEDFTDQEQVGPHGTLPFQVGTTPPYGTSGLSCTKYLVGASGFTS
jgi:hypothetical protein